MRVIHHVKILLIIMAWALGGCSTESSSPQEPGADPSFSDGGLSNQAEDQGGLFQNQHRVQPDQGPLSVNENTPLNIAGLWARMEVQSSFRDVPTIGKVNSTATTYFLVKMEQKKDSSFTVEAKICDIVINSGTPIVKIIFPLPLINTLPVQQKNVQFEAVEDQLRYVEGRYLDVRGALLEDPENDALPSNPKDARVYDQDKDGKPGITIRLKGLADGEIWLVQRAWTRLEGKVVAKDKIDGLLEWDDERNILGADNPFFKLPSKTIPDPEANRSYFRTTKVPSNFDCAQIITNKDNLFSR